MTTVPRTTKLGPPTRPQAQAYVDEIIATAQGLLTDGASIADLKIVSAAIKEMRQAFAMFAPYRHVRKVTTFGSARTRREDQIFLLAERFARLITEQGFMVITGAGPGIMEACQRGAGPERSFGINIRLPFEQNPNPHIHGDPKLMWFKYFFTRKLLFIKEAHAAVLFPGGFGTHDEGFEILTLLQTGKCQPVPVVYLDRPKGTYWKTWQRYVEDHLLRGGMISTEDLALYTVTDSAEAAVDHITRFYRVYHSSRYVRDQLVIRLQRRLPNEVLERLNDEFSDIIVRGRMIIRPPFPNERDRPDLIHLPRLAFHFNHLSFGRLRMLIDRINETP